MGYYERARELISSFSENTEYFVFSDDIEWCRANLKIAGAVFVGGRAGRLAHEDILLASLCDHNIIANSTFGWWGAWLNTNLEKVVVAPDQWFANPEAQKQSLDIVCEGWFRL